MVSCGRRYLRPYFITISCHTCHRYWSLFHHYLFLIKLVFYFTFCHAYLLFTFFMHVLSFFFLYIGEQRNISSLSDLLCIFSFIYFIAYIPSLLGSFISCHACPYLLGVSSKFIFNFMSNPDFAEVFIPNLNQYRYERKWIMHY